MWCWKSKRLWEGGARESNVKAVFVIVSVLPFLVLSSFLFSTLNPLFFTLFLTATLFSHSVTPPSLDVSFFLQQLASPLFLRHCPYHTIPYHTIHRLFDQRLQVPLRLIYFKLAYCTPTPPFYHTTHTAHTTPAYPRTAHSQRHTHKHTHITNTHFACIPISCTPNVRFSNKPLIPQHLPRDHSSLTHTLPLFRPCQKQP